VLQPRYFVADTVLDEVTFGWPRQKGNDQLRENLALGLQRAINWVVIHFDITESLLIYNLFLCFIYNSISFS